MLFDGLAPRAVVDVAGRAECVSVARRVGRKQLTQDDVIAMMVDASRAGRRVVRLKAGDPFVLARGGEEVGPAFPDLVDRLKFSAVVDGELLVRRGDTVAPFNDLQQRLNRKTVTAKMLKEHPAHVRLYDVLWLNGEDLRAHSFDQRRARLEAWMAERPTPPAPNTATDLPALMAWSTSFIAFTGSTAVGRASFSVSYTDIRWVQKRSRFEPLNSCAPWARP